MAHVALVIPVLNGAHFLRGLLHSLDAAWDTRITRIHVMDNASDDDTADVASDWFHRHQERLHFRYSLLRFKENRGFGPAVNVGLAEALADPQITHVCVFNVDQLVREWWLDWLLRALREYPALGMASSALIENWTPEEYQRALFPANDLENEVVIAHRCKGCPWLYRRETLESVGFFDEQFVFSQCEDSDHLVRLARAGWEFSMVRNSPCYHYVGSRGQAEAKRRAGFDFAVVNRARFIQKWGTWDMDTLMPSPVYPITG